MYRSMWFPEGLPRDVFVIYIYDSRINCGCTKISSEPLSTSSPWLFPYFTIVNYIFITSEYPIDNVELLVTIPASIESLESHRGNGPDFVQGKLMAE